MSTPQPTWPRTAWCTPPHTSSGNGPGWSQHGRSSGPSATSPRAPPSAGPPSPSPSVSGQVTVASRAPVSVSTTTSCRGMSVSRAISGVSSTRSRPSRPSRRPPTGEVRPAGLAHRWALSGPAARTTKPGPSPVASRGSFGAEPADSQVVGHPGGRGQAMAVHPPSTGAPPERVAGLVAAPAPHPLPRVVDLGAPQPLGGDPVQGRPAFDAVGRLVAVEHVDGEGEPRFGPVRPVVEGAAAPTRSHERLDAAGAVVDADDPFEVDAAAAARTHHRAHAARRRRTAPGRGGVEGCGPARPAHRGEVRRP